MAKAQSKTPPVARFSKLTHWLALLKFRLSRVIPSLKSFVLRHPERSFFGLLLLLGLVIVIGSILRKPPIKPEDKTPLVKSVKLFSVGRAPKLNMVGKVEKSGVVKVVAQTAGIVQRIYVNDGQTVGRGSQLAWISTNAQGGTLPSVTRQIAQKNADFVAGNFDMQKDMIAKRRDLADKLDGQSDKLRDITGASIDDTKNLISLNEDILRSLDAQLATLVSTNVAGANDAVILQTKQGKAGVQSGLLSLKSALRNSEFQADSSHEPGRISDLTRDITMKQLDIEEKSLELNRELAKLNLTIACIGESLMYPASPIAGVVERVYVQPGTAVAPGQVIASITGTTTGGMVYVSVPKAIAQKVSYVETSTLTSGGTSVELLPLYISKEPTEGSLHSVQYLLPPELYDRVSNGGTLRVELALGSADTTAIAPQIPLDAVYQTKTDAYVFVAAPLNAQSGLRATAKKIITGSVFGSYVEITDGLVSGDQIIVDRRVIDGDMVKGE